MSINYELFMFPKGQNGVKNRKKEDISKTNREKIKKLYNGKCALCGKQGQHIHHIQYRSEDKSKIDDLDNLILLCVECHNIVHQNKVYWQPRLLEMKGDKNEKKRKI